MAKRTGGRVALLIGNQNYRGGAMGDPLEYPLDDVRSMEATLKAANFRVWRVENALQKEMLKGIENFIGEAKKADVALFFYSGHGVQMDGKNYLIPILLEEVTAKKEMVDATVCVNQAVLDALTATDCPLKILILDACRTNPFKEKDFIVVPKRRDADALAPMSAKGTLIAYATADGKTASDNLFTPEFIRQIEHHRDYSLLAAIESTAQEVKRKSDGKQIPWYNCNLSGSFHLFADDVHNPPTPANNEIWVTRNEADGAEMIALPGTDGSLYLGLVTVRQYERYCAETGRAMPEAPDENPGWRKKDVPMKVTRDEASDYCVWAGGELPLQKGELPLQKGELPLQKNVNDAWSLIEIAKMMAYPATNEMEWTSEPGTKGVALEWVKGDSDNLKTRQTRIAKTMKSEFRCRISGSGSSPGSR